VKTELEQLIKTVSGTPYSDWDPKGIQMQDTLLAASAQFGNRKMNTVRTRLALGYQAINTFAMSLNEQQIEAVNSIEAAQTALAQAMAPYFERDPNDPKSPSYQAPAQPL
jgi:hypothetical protein